MAILKSAPEGAQVLDLDAARVARMEARAAAGLGSLFIKLAAGYVEVKPEVDLLAGDAFTSGRLADGLSKLLADPADVEAILAGGLSKDDLEEITRFVTGLSVGESPASTAH